MNSAFRAPALAILLLACPGCLWLDSVASDVPPVRSDRPMDPRRTEGTEPAAPHATSAGSTLVDVAGLPRIEDVDWQPVDPLVGFLPGGVRLAVGSFPGAKTAHVALTFAHRRVSASQMGLAHLVAQVVVDAPVEQGARPSLRRAVENAGGELTIDAGPSTTTISFTVPADAWGPLVGQLVDAVRTPPRSVERVEAWRERAARELGDRWADDPLEQAVVRVRSFEVDGLPRWLETVEDADLATVAAFHGRVYRPAGAVLAIAAPAAAEEAFEQVRTDLSAWTEASGRTALLPDPIPSLAAATGLYWSEAPPQPGAERARIAAVVELPPAVLKDAAAGWLLAELLVGSSVDGRIPTALAGLATPRERRIGSEGPRRRLEWIAEIEPAAVIDVRTALQQAYAMLPRARLGDQDIAAAAARARLQLMLDTSEPPRWAAAVTRNLLAGAPPDMMIGPDGKATRIDGADPLRVLADALARPHEIDLEPALESAAEQGSLLVTLGTDLSWQQRFARMPDATLPEARRALTAAGLGEQIANAEELLDRAARAVGGRPALLGLHGYQTTSVTRTGRGPEAVERLWFRLDGNLRRVRTVLGTEIETVLGPQQGFETVAGERVDLPEVERQAILDAAQRHPLALLATWARGATRYRHVSLRKVGGRSVAVLEQMSGTDGRLRVLVDVESGLIRAVIARVDLGQGPVYVREEWRDHREAGRGLRAPHHKTTLIDDGLRGTVTKFERVVAARPEAEWLQAGGPAR